MSIGAVVISKSAKAPSKAQADSATDLSGALPLYHQVYTVLRHRLIDGAYSPDRPLPTEPELATLFDVSRVTVRRSLKLLEDEGLINRRKKAGTFAVKQESSTPPEDRINIGGLLQDLVFVSEMTKSTILEFAKIIPNDEVTRKLNIPAGSYVRKVTRFRKTSEGPYSFHSSYIPEPFLPLIKKREIGNKPVLLLLEQLGVTPDWAEQILTAMPADGSIAKYLEVPVGTSLICTKRLVRDAKDHAVEYLESYFRPDKFEYRINLSRKKETLKWVPSR